MTNFEGVCVKIPKNGNGHQSFLRNLRKRIKLSEEKFAAKVGTSRNKLKTIEQKTWRKVSLGDIETLAPAFNMRPDELFFSIFVSQKGPFSRTHQTQPFFRMEFEGGIRISSWIPQNSICFVGQIQIPSKATLSKELAPSGDFVFYRMEKKGELLVSLLKTECVLKEGECISLNGPIPYELYNPTLHEVEVTIVTLPSFLGKKSIKNETNGLMRPTGEEAGNGKHE